MNERSGPLRMEYRAKENRATSRVIMIRSRTFSAACARRRMCSNSSPRVSSNNGACSSGVKVRYASTIGVKGLSVRETGFHSPRRPSCSFYAIFIFEM